MIAVDASALVAIGQDEPEATALLGALEAEEARVSSVNYVEAGVVLIGRNYLSGQAAFDDWLSALGVSLHDEGGLARRALAAYLCYGKGVHPARLNLGDVFAYALAQDLDAPLLFKGNDFSKTDARSAVQGST